MRNRYRIKRTKYGFYQLQKRYFFFLWFDFWDYCMGSIYKRSMRYFCLDEALKDCKDYNDWRPEKVIIYED